MLFFWEGGEGKNKHAFPREKFFVLVISKYFFTF